MAVVCFVRLCVVEAEGLEDGGILHREEHSVFAGIIRMHMPGPGQGSVMASGVLAIEVTALKKAGPS
jgi:hypothetical protein